MSSSVGPYSGVQIINRNGDDDSDGETEFTQGGRTSTVSQFGSIGGTSVTYTIPAELEPSDEDSWKQRVMKAFARNEEAQKQTGLTGTPEKHEYTKKTLQDQIYFKEVGFCQIL